MAVTVRTLRDGEGVQLGENLSVRLKFLPGAGKRAKIYIEERDAPHYPVKSLVRSARDSELAEKERE